MTVISGWAPCAINAATWLRQELKIPVYNFMREEFEQYFNCKIVDTEILNNGWAGTEIHFEDDYDAVLFKLRWM